MSGTRSCVGVVAMAAMLLAIAPAQSHHSFAAEFDVNKHVEIEGVLTKVDWVNPHGWWHLDVRNPQTGEIEKWDIQSESPGALRRAGITRENYGKIGDRVRIVAFGAKDPDAKYLGIVRTMNNLTTGVSFRMLADFTK